MSWGDIPKVASYGTEMTDGAPSTQQANVAALAGRILEIYEGLSRQERQLADTVLERVHDLAGYTATELANRARVSKATATRFFRRLGYDGFEEARLQARGDAGSPLHAFHPGVTAARDEDAIEAHLATETRNLSETMAILSPPDLAHAVRLLTNARKVWIVGFRDSYALALYARAMLTRVLDNLVVVPGDGASYAEDLIGIGPSDVMLAIGFRRTPHMFTSILKEAMAQEASLIVLIESESRLSFGSGALAFRCKTAGSVFDSHAAGLSVLNLICSRVARSLGPKGKARLQGAEDLHASLQDLARPDKRPRTRAFTSQLPRRGTIRS